MTASPATELSERESTLLASVPTGLLINGQWRPSASGKTFNVEDPSTGEVLLSVADAGAGRRCRRSRRAEPSTPRHRRRHTTTTATEVTDAARRRR